MYTLPTEYETRTKSTVCELEGKLADGMTAECETDDGLVRVIPDRWGITMCETDDSGAVVRGR